MRIGCGCKLVALVALVAAFAVLAASASAVVVHQRNGHFVSIALHRGRSATSIPGSVAAQHAAPLAPSAGALAYHGGPVLRSSNPYLIFWMPAGQTISATTESLLERYFTDVAADNGGSSNVFGVNRQFTDGSGFADYAQAFSSSRQAIVDTQGYPARDTTGCPDVSASYPTCLTDAQLQTEVRRLIAAHSLPTGTDANAPIYFVVLPTDVNACTDSTDCEDNSFCAYHSNMDTGGSQVLYAAIPLLGAVLPAGGPYANGKDCQFDTYDNVQQPNGDPVAEIATSYLSHEDSEAITDPIGTGWWNTTSGNEDGDNCIFSGSFNPGQGTNPNAFAPTLGGSSGAGTLYDQLINSHQYYTQSEWSNGDNNCVLRPTAEAITASLAGTPSGPMPVGSAVNFTPSASSPKGYSSVTVDFGDGARSFNNSGSAPAPVSHAYSHPGLYTAKITAVDPMGNIAKGSSSQITIGSPPTAAFSYSSSTVATGVPVSFTSNSTDPDSGITITSNAFAFGDGGSAASAAATHTFSKPGSYAVTLAVTNSLNLQSVVSHTIRVLPAKITKVKIKDKSSAGATVVVTVNAPGKLEGVGKTKRVSKPGTFKLSFKRTNAALVVRLTLKFVPASGKTVTHKVTIKF